MNVSINREPVATNRNVVAVLGPTNTGKTHLAIERMLGHASGVIGLPLRLLAREVYNRIAARIGTDKVALITGEEKIVPASPSYRVCTVEALPDRTDAAFLAIDEIQLAGDLERGHVFTDRMLNLRGREETLLLGAATMRNIVEKLLPGINVVTRPRMSMLTYAGMKKITRLPSRSAVVAFSSDEVYAIAELIRRQRGGAAVVLGSLSPRTRNAQVELFQSGDVDFLVATDAIGMGLNLDVDHVAFASDRKFDGYQFRRLSAAELAQIAGRAGRHMRDGTFGVTGRADPFEDALVEALESHRFDSVKTVQWRNRELDYSSLEALKASLDQAPDREGLTKALPSVDVEVLERVSKDGAVAGLAGAPAQVALLWQVCQIPDYRKIAPANHAELVSAIFSYLARDGVVPDDWFEAQVSVADRTDGDIDTLANRIAHVRTWTFAANRADWVRDPSYWQERTRAIEDRLSDALHERLTARFVDRRTSVLMRRLKESTVLEAEITATGDVMVEGQHVGALEGFRFAPDPEADGPEAKALRAAATKSLAGEIATRAEKAASAPDSDFALAGDGTLRWRGAAIARLAESDDILRPRLLLLADEALNGSARDRVQSRIDLWLTSRIGMQLKPLFDLRAADALEPAARGIAFRLSENLGVIERKDIAEEIKTLEQESRAGLRALGVRFGTYHIFVPALLKPVPSGLLAMLWALKNGGLQLRGLSDLSRLASSGRTSVAVDPAAPRTLFRIVGFKVVGNRAVRIDILERLADLIRPLIAWRPTPEASVPPPGAINGYGFTVTVGMTSLLGCAGEDFGSVLRALGYRVDRKPVEAEFGSAPPGNGAASQIAGPNGAGETLLARAVESSEPAVLEIAQAAETVDASEVVTEPAVEPSEPKFIEIWRPGRANGERSKTARNRTRRERRPDVVPPKESASPGSPPAIPRRESRARRPPSHETRAHERRPTPPVAGAPERKPSEWRGSKTSGKKSVQAGSFRFSTESPKGERTVADPDSPFAALAALKAELEAKERG
jgi:ATP-dependent RNA helicase SUPV3L1/SUV3